MGLIFVILTCSIFCALIRCIKFILKNQQIYFSCMTVILLYIDHRHVLATHVPIFRVVGARI